MTPREYQDRMIRETREALMGGYRRVLVQAPCGAGKTVIAAIVILGAVQRGNPVMFLAHREELVNQASRTLRRVGVDHSMIMAGRTPNYAADVQVAMIDTLRNRLRKIQPPRIVIVDEAHHAVSPSWMKTLGALQEMGSVIIGLSATPRRLSGEPLGDLFDVMVPGPTVRELIDQGALCEYVYYAPPSKVDLSAVKSRYGDYSNTDLAEASDKAEIIGDCIEHYNRLMPGKRAIVFAVNIKHSIHVVEMFNAAGIPAAHVDGEMPSHERKAAIDAFSDGRVKILSNVALFGEGFDVPACEGVIILRATQSLALHIQICGRAMRPHESKDRATIIDHVGNVLRHGLPDREHDWSLDGETKKARKKKGDEEDGVGIRQCPQCFSIHELHHKSCPICGHVYAGKDRALEAKDGQLVEVVSDPVGPPPDEAERLERRRQQGKAKSVDELMALGHSRKAAEKIVEARAAKQELISGLIADLSDWQRLTGQYPYPVFGVSFRDIKMMKPKELKALRERFEAHKAEHLAGQQDLLAGSYQPEISNV